jgi:GcrA cell cycle regulator
MMEGVMTGTKIEHDRVSRVPNVSTYGWTNEAIELLKKLWGEGKTASYCGIELGVSRNACIGKAARLGLPGRKSPIIRQGAPVVDARPREPRVDTRKKIEIEGISMMQFERLRSMTWGGKSPERIADVMEMTVERVKELQREHKLAPKKASLNSSAAKSASHAAHEKAGRHVIAMGRMGMDPKEPPALVYIPKKRKDVAEHQQCRYPIGDPKAPDFHFCGDQRRDERTPYCAHHHAVCYVGRVCEKDPSTDTAGVIPPWVKPIAAQ